VKKQDGGEAGSLDLEPKVFDAEANPVLVREVYNAYMTNQRQGTHSTKTRGMVRGGGKKPWKQKGTGRARAGSSRSPLWRGGSTIFGPQPHPYHEKVNVKKRRGAFRSLLSAKCQDDEVVVVDKLEFADGKTKSVVSFRQSHGLSGKVLIVTKEKDANLLRAAKNLGSSKAHPTRVQIAGSLSIFDLLTCDRLVMTKDAVESLQETLS